MKSEFFVALLFLSGPALASTCPSQKNDCEVVKVLTRCDVDKQALRHRIAVLERRLKEIESNDVTAEFWHVVEKKVVKHHILSLYMARDLNGVSASLQGNTVNAEAQTAYYPGLKYQYQFEFGLVPEIGISVKGSPLFGLGFEF